MKTQRFRRYSTYLAERYHKKAYRIGVDAGFGCPHRGSDRSNPGCSFCDSHGSRAVYVEGNGPDRFVVTNADLRNSIAEQVRAGRLFLERRYGAEIFFLYLQAFSNTNADVGYLEDLYRYCLTLGPFRQLIIATRPDCIDEAKAELLASLQDSSLEIWVELGLQSACNETLARIRRGHTVEHFDRAYSTLKRRNLHIAVHLILGLPGENRTDILNSVRHIAALRPDGVKLHDLHVPIGTPLYRDLLRGELSLPSVERYVDYVSSALELLPDNVVVMRLGCDTPDNRRAAPLHPIAKSRLYDAVENELKRRGTRQGAGCRQ